MRACLFKRGKLYHGKIKLDAWANEKRVSLGTTDKRVASAELEKRLRDFEAVESGRLAPVNVREAAASTLESLCGAFLKSIEVSVSIGTGKKYGAALRAVRKETGWVRLAQVTEAAVREWQRETSLRAKTANDYLSAWRRLFRWLKRQRLVMENPCEFIDPVDVHKTARQYRRALTAEEVTRLLAVAPPVRRLVYRMILETGLRRKELKALRVADFLLGDTVTPSPPPPAPHTSGPGEVRRAGSPKKECGETGGIEQLAQSRGRGPCVRVPASATKNRKWALMAIDVNTAAELREFIPAEAVPFYCPFAVCVPRCSTIRRDLAAAGISFVDTEGRRADLHAMRGTFGTGLALAGVEPLVLMQAMRHSDLKQTMKTYIDAAQLQGPVAAAVASLPWQRDAAQSQREFA